MSLLSSISQPLTFKRAVLKRLAYKVLGLGIYSLSMMLGSVAQAQSSDVNVQFIPLPISNYDIDGLADRGAPNGREAAGTRGPCLPQASDVASAIPTNFPELTALTSTVPISYEDETVQAPMGTTAQSHPTFFFYMPYTQVVVEAIQFTLQDAEDYPVASLHIPVPEQAGLLTVAWPQDQPPLQVATDYRWLLQVDCHNPLQPTDGQFTADLLVEGFIRRLDVATNTSVDETLMHDVAVLDIAAEWAASGLWNDALDVLFSHMSDHPQPDTISIALSQLLEAVGLEDMTPYVEVGES